MAFRIVIHSLKIHKIKDIIAITGSGVSAASSSRGSVGENHLQGESLTAPTIEDQEAAELRKIKKVRKSKAKSHKYVLTYFFIVTLNRYIGPEFFPRLAVPQTMETNCRRLYQLATC